jgi:hypothetical protein
MHQACVDFNALHSFLSTYIPRPLKNIDHMNSGWFPAGL